MVTVAVIGIATAVVIPTIQQSLRDRATAQQAIQFMNVFREARSRATMRGQAVMVRVDLSVTPAQVTAIEGNRSSCGLSTFDATRATVVVDTQLRANPDVLVTNTRPIASYIEFCYSPMGRMFYRYAIGTAFTEDNGANTGRALNGGFIYTFENTRFPGIVRRRVVLPLGGAPRLAI